ncbi:MAG: CaiB/BaiF CoA transferase family protein [Candidatus Saccharibacteria bacterium]
MLPLKGIRILDLTTLNGFCPMEFADFGAEVIKVERPDGGDPVRVYPPFKDDVAVYHAFMDRGKKSITLDLKSEKGQELFKKLLKNADVVLENFKVGTMEKMGLGYDVLSQINPKLVYGALTAFGSSGPLKNYICYDAIAQARSGVMDINGFPAPNPPMKIGAFISDHYSSTYLSCAVMIALYYSRATGIGQRVESSMVETLFSATDNRVAMLDKAETGWSRSGNAHPSITPHDIVKCKDGYVVLEVATDEQWQKFCTAFEKPDWAVDPKYIDNASRGKNYFGDLRDSIEDLFSSYGKNEICDRLDEVDVPASPVEMIEDAITQEQVKARNMIVNIPHQVLGELAVPGKVIKFHDESEESDFVSAPLLGQNNDEIYGEVCSADEIAELKAEGVI